MQIHDKCASVCIKCMRCAYVMHVQGMAKHSWVKVCKTHNHISKQDKQVQSR